MASSRRIKRRSIKGGTSVSSWGLRLALTMVTSLTASSLQAAGPQIRLPSNQPIVRGSAPGDCPSCRGGLPPMAGPRAYAPPPAVPDWARQGLPKPVPGEGPLGIEVIGPKGSQVLFFGGGQRYSFASPAQVHLPFQPLTRFAIAKLDLAENRTFYGTIKLVRETWRPVGVPADKISIPILIDDDDIRGLMLGQLVTKYVVLESVETAAPEATEANRPLRYNTMAGDQAIELAKSLGKIIMVVRLGNRVPTERELALGAPLPEGTTPASVQQVNYQTVAQGAGLDCPACGAGNCPPGGCAPGVCPPGGPVIPGVRYQLLPDVDSFLCDGGDVGTRAALKKGCEFFKVDATDTLAHYEDAIGCQKVCSNRVCVFAPRFVEVRTLRGLEQYDVPVTTAPVERVQPIDAMVQYWTDNAERGVTPPWFLKMRVRPSELASEQAPDAFIDVIMLEQYEHLMVWEQERGLLSVRELIGLVQPNVLKETVGPLVEKGVQFPQAIGILQGPNQIVSTSHLEEYVVDEPNPQPSPLCLQKMVSAKYAKVGDTLTFKIRYTNKGHDPIDNIVIVDSLTGRLEFVPDSNKSERDANFTTEDNDVGSLLLRWEIKGSLEPGATGEVSFEAKVR
ncbi:hypothetical protein Pan216_41400 [Planctomycetes bacterium Pan216]|uniref:DUF11 domain-containing protein n=1 Tax=Kolteria novifilia TaxID=2527975 RepID=A0A518B8J0_9BACT|nr:hypothetical protein Pan216_41400 [Planctomycetes bacterium Pan216]